MQLPTWVTNDNNVSTFAPTVDSGDIGPVTGAPCPRRGRRGRRPLRCPSLAVFLVASLSLSPSPFLCSVPAIVSDRPAPAPARRSLSVFAAFFSHFSTSCSLRPCGPTRPSLTPNDPRWSLSLLALYAACVRTAAGQESCGRWCVCAAGPIGSLPALAAPRVAHRHFVSLFVVSSRGDAPDDIPGTYFRATAGVFIFAIIVMVGHGVLCAPGPSGHVPAPPLTRTRARVPFKQILSLIFTTLTFCCCFGAQKPQAGLIIVGGG